MTTCMDMRDTRTPSQRLTRGRRLVQGARGRRGADGEREGWGAARGPRRHRQGAGARAELSVCKSVCTGHDTVYTDQLLIRGKAVYWHLREPTKYTQGSGQRAASLSLSRCHIFLLIELSSSRPPPPPHPPIPAPRRSKPETCATHAHTPRAGSRTESAPRHQLLHLRITPACEVA